LFEEGFVNPGDPLSGSVQLRMWRSAAIALPMTAFAFVGAALAEIAGCFAFWAWLRLGKSAWWVAPGVLSLCLFAYLLTLPASDQAGRSYAAYGGVYIASAVLWLWIAEGTKPDRWDIVGAAVCLTGAAIIYFGPRAATGN